MRLGKSIRRSRTSSGRLARHRLLRAAHLGSAQRRLDAAGELAQRERLGDVVVGAQLQPHHLVDLLGLGRQHDDRHRAAAAQPPADLEAVEPREHEVEHDEIERLLLEALQRLAAVGGLDDVVALLAKRDTTAASGSTARRRRAESAHCVQAPCVSANVQRLIGRRQPTGSNLWPACSIRGSTGPA